MHASMQACNDAPLIKLGAVLAICSHKRACKICSPELHPQKQTCQLDWCRTTASTRVLACHCQSYHSTQDIVMTWTTKVLSLSLRRQRWQTRCIPWHWGVYSPCSYVRPRLEAVRSQFSLQSSNVSKSGYDSLHHSMNPSANM